jgi:hypothetical protein
MRRSPATIRACIAVLLLGAVAWAQNSPPLGDVARQARKEHSSSAHVPAKQVTNEEDDGPDVAGVWRVHLCLRLPCHELSITLPKSLKWKRVKEEPGPVVISLAGAEENSNRVIRVYAAGPIEPAYPLDAAKRTFLQGWFARPEYFGRAAHIVLDEHVQIDTAPGVVSHFTVAAIAGPYRGLSVVANSPNGNFGFACVYRAEDTVAAASVCDAIVQSVKSQTLSWPTPSANPQYDDPPDDPPPDRPDDDDPQ